MQAAYAVGRAAELVVVFDTRVSRHYGRSQKVIDTTCQEIIADIERLGLSPSRLIFNDEVAWDTDRTALMGQLSEEVASSVSQGPSFFLDNARLDQQLGVTHIVRGSDRRSYRGVYEACYRALGYRPPTQVFLPLVRDGEGVKITANSPYLVNELLDCMTPDQLFGALVEVCVASNGHAPVEGGRTGAMAKLLGEEPDFLLGKYDRVMSFESRFVGVPRFQVPNQPCKPAA